MALYRGGRGHVQAAKRLKSGELPIAMRNDDQSVLWYEHGPDDYSDSGALFYGDYLLYGYWPWRMPLLIVAYFCALVSAAGFTVFALARNATPTDLHIALVTLLIAVFGFWHGFRNFRFHKYIAFDRKNHLVHIPRIFSKGMDVVRWEDAGFCVVSTITGYAGLRTSGDVYVCRPPWDLVRDGYPPMRYRAWIYGLSKRYGGVKGAERIWRAIVDFMTMPPAQSQIGDYSNMVWTVETACGGSWDQFFRYEWPRRLGAPKGILKHFRPELLGSEPNWVREPDGQWRYVEPTVQARTESPD